MELPDIGNRRKLTKSVGNYMKLPELLAIEMS
jgi:hypothetical protein